MKHFDKIVKLIPNKFTIDELIEIYHHGDERSTTFYRFFGSNRYTAYTFFSYLCNSVVMYYAEKYFFDNNIGGFTEEDMNNRIESQHEVATTLGFLDSFLATVFDELVMMRNTVGERSTTVVEQLIAGAGIDYQSRIDVLGPDFRPIRGDFTSNSVVHYGIESVLSFNDCGCCGADARMWLLRRIKELNPNFVLNFTWY